MGTIFNNIYLLIGFNNTMNSIEKKKNDENTMIVTNDFIKHLDRELRMENINCSQGTIKFKYFIFM